MSNLDILSVTERQILLSVNKKKVNHAYNICRGICSYVHGLNTLDRLEVKGLIEINKTKREKKITLTNKGKEVILCLLNLKKIADEDNTVQN